MALVTVTHFTDPACPFALSGEPNRMRLRWHYGEQLAWRLRPVVLNSAPRDFGEQFTREQFVANLERLRASHGMPINFEAASARRQLPESRTASRAAIAVQTHGDEGGDWRYMRAVRRRFWTEGQDLSSDELVYGSAADIGLDRELLAMWLDDPATDQALAASMEAARTPLPPARVLDFRLADAEDGRHRYTCPSYEFTSVDPGSEQDAVVAPGFVEYDAYDVALANLAPQLERRPNATSLDEVLEWADGPLAVAEVAAIRGVERAAASEELARAGIDVSSGWVSVAARAPATV